MCYMAQDERCSSVGLQLQMTLTLVHNPTTSNGVLSVQCVIRGPVPLWKIGGCGWINPSFISC